MKILMINPPIRDWANPNCVPLGLGYIAATLRMFHVHTIDVLDINAHRYPKDTVTALLEEKDPDIVLTGGIITVYSYLKWLTSQLKTLFPDIPIMIGGSVSTSIPEIALSTLAADIACIGEGEITTVEVANCIENHKDLSSVKGIYYRKNGKIFRNEMRKPIRDLDSLPFPAYDLFPMEIYVNNPVGYVNRDKWGSGSRIDDAVPKSMNISVTRGCPYSCKFCYCDYLGPGYRHRSARNVLEEMDFLNEEYGVTYFLWADDEPMINKKFIHEFCKLMIESKRDYQFALAGRVNLIERCRL